MQFALQGFHDASSIVNGLALFIEATLFLGFLFVPKVRPKNLSRFNPVLHLHLCATMIKMRVINLGVINLLMYAVTVQANSTVKGLPIKPSIVEYHLSEHIGTEGCSDNRIVWIIDI